MVEIFHGAMRALPDPKIKRFLDSNDFPSTNTNADANTTETISPDGNYNATKLYELTTFGYMIQFNSFSATA